MYNCSAEVSAQEAEQWYAKIMADLQELQYLWQFKTDSSGSNHLVDAGPQGCDPPQLETTNYGALHADVTYIASGPYLGQCPLHLQTVRQPNGTARISFWLNSSVNLARNPKSSSQSLELSASKQSEIVQPNTVPAPPTTQSASAASITATSAAAPPSDAVPANVPVTSPASSAPAEKAPTATTSKESSIASDRSADRPSEKYADCDELCQGLKQVLETRTTSFRQLSTSSASSVRSNTSSLGTLLKLSGAESCSIHAEPSARANSAASTEFFSHGNLAPVSTKGTNAPANRVPTSPAKQYVCYWPHDSEPDAAIEFRDLAGLLQLLMPAGWSAKQKNETDERSGAQMTVWSARDAKHRSAISLYLIGRSVGLHISSTE